MEHEYLILNLSNFSTSQINVLQMVQFLKFKIFCMKLNHFFSSMHIVADN